MYSACCCMSMPRSGIRLAMGPAKHDIRPSMFPRSVQKHETEQHIRSSQRQARWYGLVFAAVLSGPLCLQGTWRGAHRGR